MRSMSIIHLSSMLPFVVHDLCSFILQYTVRLVDVFVHILHAKTKMIDRVIYKIIIHSGLQLIVYRYDSRCLAKQKESEI